MTFLTLLKTKYLKNWENSKWFINLIMQTLKKRKKKCTKRVKIIVSMWLYKDWIFTSQVSKCIHFIFPLQEKNLPLLNTEVTNRKRTRTLYLFILGLSFVPLKKFNLLIHHNQLYFKELFCLLRVIPVFFFFFFYQFIKTQRQHAHNI